MVCWCSIQICSLNVDLLIRLLASEAQIFVLVDFSTHFFFFVHFFGLTSFLFKSWIFTFLCLSVSGAKLSSQINELNGA